MARIQFGLTLPSPRKMANKDYLANVELCLELVKGHFDSVWFTDHLQYDDSPILEGWTALTYLSSLFPQYSFGHVVLCQSFRNPALLAKMAATFQFMSGGRFILGIGAGWKEDEYKSYGYEFPSAGTRVEELEETIQIIKALWSEKQTTFQGKHYQVVDAYCEPKPDPLPTIMIGAFRSNMLRLTARHADWWNVSWLPIDAYRDRVAECERACAEVGRDPATLRRTWFGGCLCAPTDIGVEGINKHRIPLGPNFVGTPAQVVEQMRPFVDLGVDYFMLVNQAFPDLMTLQMLIDEVLPALNS
jgi:alkanesulfonate monooxygenase SsuD/methylene tetrahydromethanopterin reductase-like flavin-dependent oxidoreductase (luciferase family)